MCLLKMNFILVCFIVGVALSESGSSESSESGSSDSSEEETSKALPCRDLSAVTQGPGGVYFVFQGQTVWAVDSGTFKVANGYPKAVSDLWIDPPDVITGAYWSSTLDKFYIAGRNESMGYKSIYKASTREFIMHEDLTPFFSPAGFDPRNITSSARYASVDIETNHKAWVIVSIVNSEGKLNRILYQTEPLEQPASVGVYQEFYPELTCVDAAMVMGEGKLRVFVGFKGDTAYLYDWSTDELDDASIPKKFLYSKPIKDFFKGKI